MMSTDMSTDMNTEHVEATTQPTNAELVAEVVGAVGAVQDAQAKIVEYIVDLAEHTGDVHAHANAIAAQVEAQVSLATPVPEWDGTSLVFRSNDGAIVSEPVNLQGPRGIPGVDGLAGKDGRDGVDGAPGAQGLQGEKGDSGDGATLTDSITLDDPTVAASARSVKKLHDAFEVRMNALESVPPPDPAYHRDAVPPTNTTQLWINTTNHTLNYHNGTAWISIVGVYLESAGG